MFTIVWSLIKTALALHHREIPPSLGYETPNQAIDFAHSPFRVNDRLTDWVSHKGPRRAGVNSLGVGGTNAHAVLEEAPECPPSQDAKPWKLILLSAKTETALESQTAQLADYLTANEGINIGDVAYTLQVGRQDMTMRRAFICRDDADQAHADKNQCRPRRHKIHGTRENDHFCGLLGAQQHGMRRLNAGAKRRNNEPEKVAPDQ